MPWKDREEERGMRENKEDQESLRAKSLVIHEWLAAWLKPRPSFKARI